MLLYFVITKGANDSNGNLLEEFLDSNSIPENEEVKLIIFIFIYSFLILFYFVYLFFFLF